MAKIFWVEDQSHWVGKFQDALKSMDLDGDSNELLLFKFSEAARQFIKKADQEADHPDIALLDARMNGYDGAGFSVVEALRKKWPDVPVIFLSEHNGTDIERAALTEYGVVDFISKHQRNAEEVLSWRMKAALRQADLKSPGTPTSVNEDVLSNGDLKIDLSTWEVYWQGKKLMNPDNPKRPLAPTPRRMLRVLVECSPRPVSVSQMAEALGLDPDTYQAATYRQHIKTLRRAFEAVDADFTERCKQDHGLVTFGEAGAYCWKP